MKNSDAAQTEEYRSALNSSARLLRANRPGEAVEILTPLQQQFPNDPDIAINLGGALILQRKWDQAVRVLLPAARQHMGNAMLWTNLAAAYLGRLEIAGPKQQQQAINAYEQALRADPQAPNVHYHLALIYKEQGNLSRAAALFQRALEIKPGDRDAASWLERLSQQIVAQTSAPNAQSGTTAKEETGADSGAREN
ncbi:MAG: tetratricopeptide repeat protein [Caldilineaceae bacterium]|nr:tetratricopeptide repeat protein [Caldilineaceae bacterium]HRJ41914.1 tetratricopeptide repeat protein [Caldilineaceae bacterium]